jgi:hypothetical protein
MFARPEITISRWTVGSLPPGLSRLTKAAVDEGCLFLGRLQDEWVSGSNRFAGPGECLFIAETASVETPGSLVGISGICRDPYQIAPDVGRLRHVYVDRPYRNRGIARELVRGCLACSGTRF